MQLLVLAAIEPINQAYLVPGIRLQQNQDITSNQDVWKFILHRTFPMCMLTREIINRLN